MAALPVLVLVLLLACGGPRAAGQKRKEVRRRCATIAASAECPEPGEGSETGAGLMRRSIRALGSRLAALSVFGFSL